MPGRLPRIMTSLLRESPSDPNESPGAGGSIVEGRHTWPGGSYPKPMISWSARFTSIFVATGRRWLRFAAPHGRLSFNLRHLIRALSTDFTVYYYDLIGYGQSDKAPGDVSLGIQNRQIAQADCAYTDEVQSLYARVDRPALILWGREDTWIPLKQGEALHDMIPGSILRVIEDAGHLVVEEPPQRLMEAIHPFLLNAAAA